MTFRLKGPIQLNLKKPYVNPHISEVKIIKENGDIFSFDKFNEFKFGYEIDYQAFIDKSDDFTPFFEIFCKKEGIYYENRIIDYDLDCLEINGNIIKINDKIPINSEKIETNDKIIITLTDCGKKKLNNTLKKYDD